MFYYPKQNKQLYKPECNNLGVQKFTTFSRPLEDKHVGNKTDIRMHRTENWI